MRTLRTLTPTSVVTDTQPGAFASPERTYTPFQLPRIHATIACFYMLTNMTLSAATPASRRNETAAPTVLIYGSAIKTSANPPGFSNMQFSNRRQTGGLNDLVDQLPRERSAAADHFPLITRHPSLACPDAAKSRRRATALILAFPAPNATLFAPTERGKHRRERPNEPCENRIT